MLCQLQRANIKAKSWLLHPDLLLTKKLGKELVRPWSRPCGLQSKEKNLKIPMTTNWTAHEGICLRPTEMVHPLQNLTRQAPHRPLRPRISDPWSVCHYMCLEIHHRATCWSCLRYARKCLGPWTVSIFRSVEGVTQISSFTIRYWAFSHAHFDLYWNFDFRVSGKILPKLAFCLGGSLRNLNLGHCKGLKTAELCTIVSNCRSIYDLNIEGCDSLTDDAVESISRNLEKLEVLNMGIFCTIFCRLCSSVHTYFRFLFTFFSQGSIPRITDNGLSHLSLPERLGRSSRISVLNVSNCENITDTGLISVC